MLAPETALRVIPMLAVASNVCPGWHGIMMPRLTTLSHLLASFAECEDDSVGEAIVSCMNFAAEVSPAPGDFSYFDRILLRMVWGMILWLLCS
jgi:hypothetical protein